MDAAGQQAEISTGPIRRRWGRLIGRAFVLYIVVPYAFVVLAFFVFQRRLMYQPAISENLQVESVGLDPVFINDVQIETSDGSQLNGWLLKQTKFDLDNASPLVVYFPGNASNRLGRIYDLYEFAATGFDVLIFDYRGYGDSTGSPTEHDLTSDARLVWNFACDELKYDESKIVVFGESLGGAVALSMWSADAVSHPQPAALMLTSTFVSMPATVGWHYPMFPFQYLLLDRWPSSERIGQVQIPVIVFHGTEDEIVPIVHGRELKNAAVDASFVEIKGAGHNDIPFQLLKTELERIRESLTEQ